MKNRDKLIVGGLLIIFGVTFRILPHAWNVAPIAAIALFAGSYLGARYAIIVPVAAMLIGDYFIGGYEWQLAFAVYGSFMLAGAIGVLIKKNISVSTVLAGSICASVVFFLLTNYAVWQFSPWYEKSFNGLLDCFVAALPFFRNTLAGDMIYTIALFGSYEAVKLFFRHRQLA